MSLRVASSPHLNIHYIFSFIFRLLLFSDIILADSVREGLVYGCYAKIKDAGFLDADGSKLTSLSCIPINHFCKAMPDAWPSRWHPQPQRCGQAS